MKTNTILIPLLLLLIATGLCPPVKAASQQTVDSEDTKMVKIFVYGNAHTTVRKCVDSYTSTSEGLDHVKFSIVAGQHLPDPKPKNKNNDKKNKAPGNKNEAIANYIFVAAKAANILNKKGDGFIDMMKPFYAKASAISNLKIALVVVGCEGDKRAEKNALIDIAKAQYALEKATEFSCFMKEIVKDDEDCGNDREVAVTIDPKKVFFVGNLSTNEESTFLRDQLDTVFSELKKSQTVQTPAPAHDNQADNTTTSKGKKSKKSGRDKGKENGDNKEHAHDRSGEDKSTIPVKQDKTKVTEEPIIASVNVSNNSPIPTKGEEGKIGEGRMSNQLQASNPSSSQNNKLDELNNETAPEPTKKINSNDDQLQDYDHEEIEPINTNNGTSYTSQDENSNSVIPSNDDQEGSDEDESGSSEMSNQNNNGNEETEPINTNNGGSDITNPAQPQAHQQKIADNDDQTQDDIDIDDQNANQRELSPSPSDINKEREIDMGQGGAGNVMSSATESEHEETSLSNHTDHLCIDENGHKTKPAQPQAEQQKIADNDDQPQDYDHDHEEMELVNTNNGTSYTSQDENGNSVILSDDDQEGSDEDESSSSEMSNQNNNGNEEAEPINTNNGGSDITNPAQPQAHQQKIADNDDQTQDDIDIDDQNVNQHELSPSPSDINDDQFDDAAMTQQYSDKADFNRDKSQGAEMKEREIDMGQGGAGNVMSSATESEHEETSLSNHTDHLCIDENGHKTKPAQPQAEQQKIADNDDQPQDYDHDHEEMELVNTNNGTSYTSQDENGNSVILSDDDQEGSDEDESSSSEMSNQNNNGNEEAEPINTNNGGSYITKPAQPQAEQQEVALNDDQTPNNNIDDQYVNQHELSPFINQGQFDKAGAEMKEMEIDEDWILGNQVTMGQGGAGDFVSSITERDHRNSPIFSNENQKLAFYMSSQQNNGHEEKEPITTDSDDSHITKPAQLQAQQPKITVNNDNNFNHQQVKETKPSSFAMSMSSNGSKPNRSKGFVPPGPTVRGSNMGGELVLSSAPDEQGNQKEVLPPPTKNSTAESAKSTFMPTPKYIIISIVLLIVVGYILLKLPELLKLLNSKWSLADVSNVPSVKDGEKMVEHGEKVAEDSVEKHSTEEATLTDSESSNNPGWGMQKWFLLIIFVVLALSGGYWYFGIRKKS